MGEQMGKEVEYAESTTIEMQLLLGLRMLGRMNPWPL